MKAIIIGAGIGGLTTALALQKQGIHLEIYEKSEEIKAIGAGLSLWKNALIVLDALEIGHKLRRTGIPSQDGAIRSQSGDILARLEQSNPGEVATLLVHRAELHQLLQDHIHSPIYTGKSLRTYTQDSAQVTAHFEDGTTATGDILIGADGIHSIVRSRMFPGSKPHYAGYTAFRAVIPIEHSRLNGTWGESWGKGQRFGITLLADNQVYWFCTHNAPEGLRYTPQQTRENILNWFGDWHHPIPELLAETPAESLLHHDIYHLQPLSTWQDGRVVLLGDAAHAMTPDLGQGACQAIEDAFALAQSLAGNTSISIGLAQYQALRIPRTTAIMTQSRRMGSAGQLENSLLCGLRNLVMKHTPASIRNRELERLIGYDITGI